MSFTSLSLKLHYYGEIKKTQFEKSRLSYADVVEHIKTQHGTVVHDKVTTGELKVKYLDHYGDSITLGSQVINYSPNIHLKMTFGIFYPG